MACQPTDPCYNAACADCNDLIQPCLDICPTPIYTNLECISSIDDKCVTITIPDDVCLDIVKPTRLSDVLTKIISKIKASLGVVTSTSLVIVPITGSCSKSATIELVPSIQAGNILILGSDGKPYVPPAGGGSIGMVSVIPQDTHSVHLSGNGLLQTPLEADVKLDPSPTNIIFITSNGLLTEDVNIKDIKDSLKQHIIFERPIIRRLTSLDNTGATINTGVVSLGNIDYATDYSPNNPNVKLNWGDTGIYENSLNNAVSGPNSLTHNFGLQPESGEIELKTYNNTFLNKLNIDKNSTCVSGFKFLKGASLITYISIDISASGTSGVFDFKNMYNVTNLFIQNGFNDINSRITLKNTQDLESVGIVDIRGFYEDDTKLTLLNPNLGDVQFISCKGIRSITLGNITSLRFHADVLSLEILDMYKTNLNSFILSNCGVGFAAYINNILFKPKAFSLNNGNFDFSINKNFVWHSVNGLAIPNTVYLGTYNQPVPTKFFTYNINNGNILEFVSVNQDWVKDEVIKSLDNNNLINGGISIVNESFAFLTLGLNSLSAYYNPVWSPLNGMAGTLLVQNTNTVITNAIPQYIGLGYNSIPIIVYAGPGSGANIQTVMQLEDNGTISILTGGAGYVANTQITLISATPGMTTAVVLNITGIVNGSISGFSIVNAGAFTTLPANGILSHAGGFSINVAFKFVLKSFNVISGGIGYTDASIYKLETNINNGTGSGTASTLAKSSIESLHNKGWQMNW